MKIAIVTTSYPSEPGDPAGHFVEAEARALARDGHRVTVIAPGSIDSETSNDTLTVIRIFSGDAFGWPGALTRLRERPSRAIDALSFALRARRALRSSGPFDRAIAHWLLPSAWPIAVGIAPLEVVAHGTDVRLLLRAPRALGRSLVAALVSRGTEFRFVSRELRDRLSSHTGVDLSNARIEPAHLEIEKSVDRDAARRELDIDARARLAVVVGRIVDEKRVDVALGAASLLPNAQIVVVGDGPRARELAARFPNVRFVGRVSRERALTWMAAADLVVSASKHEGAPTAIREARALGTPVVSVAAGDLRAWAKLDPELYVLE